MAVLSSDAVKKLQVAVADQAVGNAIASNANDGDALASATAWTVAALIVATATSTTTDFGALKVGDKVVIAPSVAGNAQFVTVATAGTLPQAAVVGSLYVVLRAFVAPADSAVVL